MNIWLIKYHRASLITTSTHAVCTVREVSDWKCRFEIEMFPEGLKDGRRFSTFSKSIILTSPRVVL